MADSLGARTVLQAQVPKARHFKARCSWWPGYSRGQARPITQSARSTVSSQSQPPDSQHPDNAGGPERLARDSLAEARRSVQAPRPRVLENSRLPDAARLFISEATVKTHVLHIYAKLGVNDRAAAVATGFERGLLPRP
jgi:hypothetical protein